MAHRKSFIGWSILFFCLSLTPFAFGQQMPSSEKRAAASDYRIGAGDVLLVEVAGEPDLKRKVKVMEQGTIRLPYVDRDLKVAGLTEAQVGALLREEYLAILKEPQVTIYIEEYGARAASVMGAVNKPQRIPLTRTMQLLDLISAGGGLTDKAGSVVQLIHTKPAADESGQAASAEKIENIDLRELVKRPQELNREIQNGDVVNVPEAGIFYVAGSVNKPGSFPLKDTIKLSQAIAMAGGWAPDSKKKEIHLFRTIDPNQPATEQMVNFAEIEKDPSKDIILRPYDVILVPESTRTKSARTLLQTFVGGLANAAGFGIIR
jgi:polysaccharide export outer membrane protein